MASYVLKLTPDTVTPASEGSLDTAIVDGVSIQRTGYFEIHNGSSRKVVTLSDGETVTDTMPVLTDNPNFVSA